MTRHTTRQTNGTRLLAAVMLSGIAAVGMAGTGAASGFESSPGVIDHFSFAGGTLGDYIDRVRAMSPEANIVVDQRLAEFPVPPMELRSIDVGSLMWVLETATGDWNNEAYLCELTSHPGPNGQLYRLGGVLEQQRASRGTIRKKPAHTTRVASVAETVGMGMPAEDIVSAMELAIEVNGHAIADMTITLHEPTQLVILHGPSSAIGICTEVLDQVRQSAMMMDFEVEGGVEAAADQAELAAAP